MNYFYLTNIVLGIAGFNIAYHIYKHKMFQKPLTCPFHLSCDVVIHSKFGKIFGIDIAALGTFYYLLVTFSYFLALVYSPSVYNFSLASVLILISTLAAIFSIYLVSIMQFVLKQWCSWCVGSAFTSLSIATVSLVNFFLK